ncbi:MAG: VIT1/CCC1 transporter family protein [Acidimicrobiia bacterium]
MEALHHKLPEKTPPYRPHQGPHRQYIRDIILGVNDGLVSIFLLVVGVVGGGFESREVLLAGLAGAIAGAVSMAAGEYMATKSQEEVFESEMELEREHLKYYRDIEREEIRDMFGDIGIEGQSLESIVDSLDRNDEAFMKVMMALEFGIVETERRSPTKAMLTSGILFLTGAAPSLVPFIFISSATAALVWAAIGSGLALFAVGAAKTLATRKNPLRSGFENLGVAAAGAAAAFTIGLAYNTYV